VEAIRKIAAVENHKVILDLPDTFNCGQVEVIIFPFGDTVTSKSATWQEDFLSVSQWEETDNAISDGCSCC